MTSELEPHRDIGGRSRAVGDSGSAAEAGNQNVAGATNDRFYLARGAGGGTSSDHIPSAAVRSDGSIDFSAAGDGRDRSNGSNLDTVQAKDDCVADSFASRFYNDIPGSKNREEHAAVQKQIVEAQECLARKTPFLGSDNPQSYDHDRYEMKIRQEMDDRLMRYKKENRNHGGEMSGD